MSKFMPKETNKEMIEEKFRKRFNVIGNYFSKDSVPSHPIHIPFVSELCGFTDKLLATQKAEFEKLIEEFGKQFSADGLWLEGVDLGEAKSWFFERLKDL